MQKNYGGNRKETTMYSNIKEDELLTLVEVCQQENNSDFSKTAHDIKTIDMLLRVMRMRSLIDRRSKKKNTRWSRGRNFQDVMSAIIGGNLSKTEANDEQNDNKTITK